MRNEACPCGSGRKYKKCCGAASASVPAAPDARTLLARGIAALRAGRAAEAVPTLQAALRADPANVEAHLAAGSALLACFRAGEAASLFRRATVLQPDRAEAWRDLGIALESAGEAEPAIAAYAHATALAPRLADAPRRRGALLAAHGRTEEAAEAYEQAAQAERDPVLARLLRADAALLRGDAQAAEDWARQAVALDPRRDDAQGTLGGVLYASGCFEEAASCFEAAIRRNPKAAKSWDGLVHCRRFGADDADIPARLAAVLARPDLAPTERMILAFARGKVLDDMGRYEAAMSAFDEGNRIRAQLHPFDAAALAARVDHAIARHEAAAPTDAGSADERPLFVVGMYRAGTTLVEQILARHPAIESGGELTILSASETEAVEAGADPAPMIARYTAALDRLGPGAARVTDKLPFNVFRLGAILRAFPRARIVLCERDPRDTCLSIYTTLFATPIGFAARKRDLALAWAQYRRIADYWKRVLPETTLLTLRYETLVANREAETRRLLAFTGLPWDEACLAPERSPRMIATASAWQARQPVHTASVGRWRHYAPWLGEVLTLEEVELLT